MIASENEFCTIPLTQGYVAKVDVDDFGILVCHKWYAVKSRNTVYAQRTIIDNGHKKHIRMHSVIMNPEIGKVVDHKDGDGLNNVKSNLRVCTNKQNIWNQRVRKTNKSGYKGVYFDRTRKKWRSQITVDGKIKSLGFFDNVIDGANAYSVASKIYHGDYSKD